ncbi:MAG: CapA family protein [Eubacteriales bacterium]|nr:CapA family protein [Eubacteriales bacterium]
MLIAAALAAAIFCFAKYVKLLPDWIIWKEKTIVCSQVEMPLLEEVSSMPADDPGDIPDEIVLKNRRLTVRKNDEKIWESPEGIKVSDFIWADIDRDEQCELLLLCWKIGRFGTHRPFWVREDEKEWSEHIFIYDWEEGQIKEKWMASDIGMDALSWSYDSVNKLLIRETNGRVTRWDYAAFGLSFVGECTEAKEITFLVTGDNLIHDSIIREADRKHNGDFSYLYEGAATEIKKADVAVLCQETVFVKDSREYSDYPFFGTPLGVGEAAVNAGFDLAAAATNHVLDKGMEGIDTTAAFFWQKNVPCLGIQDSSHQEYDPCYVLEKEGIRIAFLNYTFSTNGTPMPEAYPYAVHTLTDEEQVKKDIREAKKNSDFTLVIVHWGEEYREEIDTFQKKWTEIFAEENVDLVIGNHPHVLQKRGRVRRKDGQEMYVYYSLGNFVAAQREEVCQMGGLAEFSVRKSDRGACAAELSLRPVSNFMKAEILP